MTWIASAALELHHSLPYGALLRDDGVQFAVFSRHATCMRLLLYDDVSDTEPTEVVTFDPVEDRHGDVWNLFVPGLTAGQLYHFQADGPFAPELGHRFDGSARLIDPYAKALAGDFQPATDGITRPPKCVVIDDDFDWKGDRPLARSLAESIIYEMHVRGFTKSPTSDVAFPGTYAGVIEKIPYLKSLGITAVELMPVHEFPTNAPTGEVQERANYWGYETLAFFAPHRGYASSQQPGAQVNEFKAMVRALHEAGIEVILDVVFNHTAEGNEHGPTLSFKGLENSVYYMLEEDRAAYRNYSGCGNTVNGNHPVVREMIFNCLRYWVLNYHVDGFRFDLASILSRAQNGALLPNPPLVEAIAEDPLLADTTIIAEAWDAAGAYQVGSFGRGRWAEWNGRYRDDVRRFWRGDAGMTGAMATRLSGSSDLYQSSGRRPYHSINFATSHDGFTLNDLVSFADKHNQANGEYNFDGDNNNHSMNFGIEGPTSDRRVDKLRIRQIKNFLATLALSHGTPMLVAGDECRRTQRGNNNPWCQDNPISWFDWSLAERNQELLRFVQALLDFRKGEPTIQRTDFLTGTAPAEGELPDVSWYDFEAKPRDWHRDEPSLVALLAANHQLESPYRGRNLLIAAHAGATARRCTIPQLVHPGRWRLFCNTAARAPADIFPAIDGPHLPNSRRIRMAAWSLVCYVADEV